jgi:hypothetical protein
MRKELPSWSRCGGDMAQSEAVHINHGDVWLACTQMQVKTKKDVLLNPNLSPTTTPPHPTPPRGSFWKPLQLIL